jgi:putative endonuclease
MACRAEPLEPSQRPRLERVAAFRLGLSAESRAAMFLIAKGYRIVAAAELWLAHHPDDNERDIRFDVMLVAPGRLPQHIANAFDASR